MVAEHAGAFAQVAKDLKLQKVHIKSEEFLKKKKCAKMLDQFQKKPQ